MNPSKKPARVWNWSDTGTRWSSRASSSIARTSSSSAPRQDLAYSGLDPNYTIPSSTGSADGNPEADSDYNSPSSRSRYFRPPESTTSFYNEGVAQGSRSTHHRVAGGEGFRTVKHTRNSHSTTPSIHHPDTPGTKNSSSLSPVTTSSVPTPAPRLVPMANIQKHSARQQRAAGSNMKSEETRALLRKHLAEMQKTHAYFVKSALTAARFDLDTREPPAKVIYDRVSPFKDMKSIEITSAEAKERKCDVGKFAVKYHGKGVENKFLVPAAISITPKGLAQMPKYHSYTTLRNNILADDDEVMRYFPYFGEDAEEDEINQLNLEDTFVDRTKASAEDGRRSEYAAMYTTFIFAFFADLQLSLSAVTSYLIGPNPRSQLKRQAVLPDDFDFEDPKVNSCREALESVSIEDLDRAESVCKVWKEETGVSLWEVVKRVDVMVKDNISATRIKVEGGKAPDECDETAREAKEAAREAKEATGNPAPYSLESYAALNCLLCFMHECPFHVNKDHDRLTMNQTDSSEDGDARASSRRDSTIILKLATNVPGWSSMSKGSAADAWGSEHPWCSEGCFLKDDNADTAVTGEWSPAQEALLRSSAAVLKNNPRCACLIASIINKTCAEINRQLMIENLLTPLAPPKPLPPTLSEEPSKTLKRKKVTVPAIPGYPADCYSTHAHDKRTAFQACRHLGHCTDTCPCVMSHVTCEKSCICSPSCPRRWRGCACKRTGGSCSKETCICVKANRECDVDLCHSCGAYEVLDPMNRHTVDKPRADGCQNVWLQRDAPKRTLLGRSAVAGFGLFMGEDVKNAAFLGEYKGEVITSDEADRRGKLYDKRGVSFLFNLNMNQVIDATRAGNKFRYVNHSSKRPNCGAKVLMAGCTHRIGMFAKRDLKAGEELFFDYGYNNKQVKFVQKEFEPPEEEEPVPLPIDPKRTRRTKKKRELVYLKGGKGTTERSRAKVMGMPALAVGTTTTTTTTTTTFEMGFAMSKIKPGTVTMSRSASTETPGRGRSQERKPVKSAEYVRDSEDDSEGDLGQDEGTDEEDEEDVDEEYEPESEESAAVGVTGPSTDGTGGEEDDDEPLRRKKRMRSR